MSIIESSRMQSLWILESILLNRGLPGGWNFKPTNQMTFRSSYLCFQYG